MPRSRGVVWLAAAASAAVACVLVWASSIPRSLDVEAVAGTAQLDVSEPYLVTDDDVRMPELPTGCEATSAATLLRMHGIDVSKTDVADAMSKGDNFVYEFWGDPYSEDGLAILSPGLGDVMSAFLPEYMRAVRRSGPESAPVSEEDLPCICYVTSGCEDPVPSGYSLEADGVEYPLLRNSCTVVVTAVDEGKVTVVDPETGLTEYPRDVFDRAWEANTRQVVSVADGSGRPYSRRVES